MLMIVFKRQKTKILRIIKYDKQGMHIILINEMFEQSLFARNKQNNIVPIAVAIQKLSF